MLRRLMGAALGIALMIAMGLVIEVEPVAADGCGQECGTSFDQCVVESGSAAHCEDEGALYGWCRDWGSTTCLW